jgi:hypothetical protein
MSQAVRRKYLKPMPSDPRLEKMDKKTFEYRSRMHIRECIMCDKEATQLLCFEGDGYSKIEKYCDFHVTQLD